MSTIQKQSMPVGEAATAYDAYPERYRKRLLAIRKLILAVPRQHPEIGELEETLKWGEPSYLPRKKNIGSTVRLNWRPDYGEKVGLFVMCSTTLIAEFKTRYETELAFEGKRCVWVPMKGALPTAPLKHCISLALTYHLRKKAK
ncbi:MAG: DUF1801 domain-containing protein [Parvibaculaceae bacterium]|nr:DUF1801 domain-containing protein [Parvibaculaceae bacterium]